MMAAEPSGLALGAELREERRREKQAQAEAIFEDARARATRRGVALDTIYVPERLADEAILETATSCGADLIVMASHGHRGLRKLLLGSQTQSVLGRGHLPVLVVRGGASLNRTRSRGHRQRFRIRPRVRASPPAPARSPPVAGRARAWHRALPHSRRGSRRAAPGTHAPA